MHCEVHGYRGDPKTMTNKYTNNTMNNPRLSFAVREFITNKQKNRNDFHHGKVLI